MLIKRIYDLREAQGSLNKEKILRDTSSEEWIRFIKAVYDTTITYGIGAEEILPAFDYDNMPDEAFYKCFQQLADRKVTGNNALDLRNSLYSAYGIAAHCVFSRTLDCGVSVKTLNKVYGNIIPVFQVMKAKNYEGQKLTFPLIADIKYDGFNHTIVKNNTTVNYYSSGGKLFTLEDDGIFTVVPNGVYFAELIGTDGKLGDRQNCGIATTLRTNTSKGIKNTAKPNWIVFDAVTLEEFTAGKSTTLYAHRRETVNIYFPNNRPKSEVINSVEELEYAINHVVKDGYEGLVLKQLDMIWDNSGKRTLAMAKYKKLATYDLLVKDTVPGTGRLEGVIGSLKLYDRAGNWVGDVGTGLNDSDRLKDFINKVVEVKAERISPKGMLIQPVFLSIRDDKSIDDIDAIEGV